MFVINENGDGAVNLEQCVFVGMGSNDQTGEVVLIGQAVHGNGVFNMVLASGGDRPKRAADAITKALKQGLRILDLNDLLGAKPDLTIPAPGSILRPDGWRKDKEG